MINKKCKDCGINFTATSHQKPYCPDCAKKRRKESVARYGRSQKGRDNSRKFRLTHTKHYSGICPQCGGEMHRDAKYMCKSCQIKLLKSRPPEEHPQWKGGRTHTEGGYVFIRQPSHPHANKSGYVQEHILIWEQANNKSLPDGWIIHHLNGIKHDNRPVNLVALPNWKHYLVLEAKAKRIQELEALLNHQTQLL